MSKSTNKVIWAVDAFSNDTALTRKMASFLKSWVRDSNSVIEPVYVLSPDQVRVPSQIFSSVVSESEEQARVTLDRKLKATELPNLLAPVFLKSNDFSLRTAVKTLLDYARDSGAELITVGTQSKKGVSRFLFGSFAESLVLYSDIPVLMLTPENRPSREFKKLVFATDLSEVSKAAFNTALDLAQRHRLEVLLYNRIEYSCEKTMALIRKNPDHERHMDQDLLRRSRGLEEMSAEAHSRHIKINVVIDSKPSQLSIADCVLNIAESRKANLIAIAAESGVTPTTVLGSVARQILRRSQLPVWVIHPSREALNKKKGAA